MFAGHSMLCPYDGNGKYDRNGKCNCKGKGQCKSKGARLKGGRYEIKCHGVNTDKSVCTTELNSAGYC
jgi:hypothetical protein